MAQFYKWQSWKLMYRTPSGPGICVQPDNTGVEAARIRDCFLPKTSFRQVLCCGLLSFSGPLVPSQVLKKMKGKGKKKKPVRIIPKIVLAKSNPSSQ